MTGRSGRPNVFTVPSGLPFLRVLASAVVDGTLPQPGGTAPDPLGLSDYTILLPTRRAVRALSETFLQVSKGVQLLPRMTPLGDVDEDELLLSIDVGGARQADALSEKPSISQLERRLILTRLILQWVSHRGSDGGPSVHTPAQAAWLAADLARLIDMFDTEQCNWSGLDGLIEQELSGHWDASLEFLGILREVLPKLMAERGLINPMQRRNLLLNAEAARLEHATSGLPVIAAGSTGSIPATANLLRVIANLENGAVVLPGLDLYLEDQAWDAIGPAHPQYGLKQLLEQIGIERSDVEILPGPAAGTPHAAARSAFLSEVMRPADASEHWSTVASGTASDDMALALQGIRRVTAPSQREEALAIALIMRETLQHSDRSAALVTPDRGLARRVSAELSRWDIAVDDSAGTPLHATPAATFMLLLLESVASECAAVPLLGLLRHPLAGFGRAPNEVRRLAGFLEITALRGLATQNGLDGIGKAIDASRTAQASPRAYQHPGIAQVEPEDWDALVAFVNDLQACLQPLVDLFLTPDILDAGELLSAHIACTETACGTDASDMGTAPAVWQGDAGEALAQFLGSLLEVKTLMPALRPQDYPPFLSALMQGHVVRSQFGQHPNLHIWGLLEARLMHTDVVILGGLTEGSWPPQAVTDPWLNRPMRAGLDLEPPERRLGLTAHDFVQSACAPEVFLTLSDKIEGSPAVPSRWLLRFDALLGATGGQDGVDDPRWVSWALGLDHAQDYRPISKPRPQPPIKARPRRLSVTQVETWIRDPYAIFARQILALEPLAPLAGSPSAADRGTLIHDILHRVARLDGPISTQALLQQGEEVFRDYTDYPDVIAFWWPRFERVAAWLSDEELFSKDGIARRLTEVSGELDIGAPGGPFKLRARADRIDITEAGGAIIMDYKTGQPPSGKQVASGLSPQMSLEAAIAMNGGFADTPPLNVSGLTYVRISGGEPPGEIRPITAEPAADLAERALDGLKRRIAAFDRLETPYLPRAAVELERQQRDYDHLARHLEWARQAAEGGGE